MFQTHNVGVVELGFAAITLDVGEVGRRQIDYREVFSVSLFTAITI